MEQMHESSDRNDLSALNTLCFRRESVLDTPFPWVHRQVCHGGMANKLPATSYFEKMSKSKTYEQD